MGGRNCSRILFKNTSECKHLKGQLGPPVSDEKVCVMKNDHFLKLCHEGQSVGWDPQERCKMCVCDEKLELSQAVS